MSEREEYARFLARIGEAMSASDPVAAFGEVAADPALPEQYRRALGFASPDGVRLSALLVAKLRFEALLNFSAQASEAFASDPEAFTEQFRRYHREVSASHYFPCMDASRFEAWAQASTSDAT